MFLGMGSICVWDCARYLLPLGDWCRRPSCRRCRTHDEVAWTSGGKAISHDSGLKIFVFSEPFFVAVQPWHESLVSYPASLACLRGTVTELNWARSLWIGGAGGRRVNMQRSDWPKAFHSTYTLWLSGRISVIDCIETEIGEMREATKCVPREQRIVQAYLWVKMRAEYEKCVHVGRSASDWHRTKHVTTHWCESFCLWMTLQELQTVYKNITP